MPDAPIIVLLSLGRHPVSGRARRAERDARALTLALATGLPVVGLHTGPPHEALRDYLGMGLKQLVALDVPEGGDPVPALAAFIGAQMPKPRLILAGSMAEAGEASGLVPYLVAEQLGLALAPGVASLAVEPEGLAFVQALPRGARRQLFSALPVLATVDLHGPRPRQVARGPALRGVVRVDSVPPSPAVAVLSPEITARRPARMRPKRIGPAATQAAGGETRLLVDPDPREAAREILKFLEAERLLPQRRTEASQERTEESPISERTP
jgi:electron transfer flavoprotein beta subunit